MLTDGHRRIATSLFLKYRPIKGKYTVIEALLSIDLDRHLGRTHSDREYSRIFGHSRDWVSARLREYSGHLDALQTKRKEPTIGHQSATEQPLIGHQSATTLDPDPEQDPEEEKKEPAPDGARSVPQSVLIETSEAFASYGRNVRVWSDSRRRAMLARARECGSDYSVLPSAVHGYAYYHRGTADNGFDPMKHLTPETIFRASNFPKYLDAAKDAEQAGRSPPFPFGPETPDQKYARMAKEMKEEERNATRPDHTG